MSKRTKKNMSYNTKAVEALANEFEVSTYFVRESIKKNKHSKTAQTIEKKYKELVNPSDKAIQEFKSNPV